MTGRTDTNKALIPYTQMTGRTDTNQALISHTHAYRRAHTQTHTHMHTRTHARARACEQISCVCVQRSVAACCGRPGPVAACCGVDCVGGYAWPAAAATAMDHTCGTMDLNCDTTRCNGSQLLCESLYRACSLRRADICASEDVRGPASLLWCGQKCSAAPRGVAAGWREASARAQGCQSQGERARARESEKVQWLFSPVGKKQGNVQLTPKIYSGPSHIWQGKER